MNRKITTDFEYESERLNALIGVIARTGWTIKPASLALWRATVETSGYISGLEDLGELTIYATNGVLGLFRRHDTGRVDTYHTHRPTNRVEDSQEQLFTGKITPLVKKPKKVRAPDTDAAGNPLPTKSHSKKQLTAKQKRIQILNNL